MQHSHEFSSSVNYEKNTHPILCKSLRRLNSGPDDSVIITDATQILTPRHRDWNLALTAARYVFIYVILTIIRTFTIYEMYTHLCTCILYRPRYVFFAPSFFELTGDSRSNSLAQIISHSNHSA